MGLAKKLISDCPKTYSKTLILVKLQGHVFMQKIS